MSTIVDPTIQLPASVHVVDFVETLFQIEYRVWLFLTRRFHPIICFCHFSYEYQLLVMGCPRSFTLWTPLLLKISWLPRMILFPLFWPYQVLMGSLCQTRSLFSGLLMSIPSLPSAKAIQALLTDSIPLPTSCWLVLLKMKRI